MADSLGKKFEQKFALDWRKSFPNTFLYRLKDQMTGYKVTSQNPCDFLAFHHKKLWLLECKETKENTFNFAKLTQLENLKSYLGLEDVYSYVIIWFSTHDKVIAVPIMTVVKMKEDNLKSINVKMLQDKSYNIIEIPSVKKRVFLDSDYSGLLNLKEGE